MPPFQKINSCLPDHFYDHHFARKCALDCAGIFLRSRSNTVDASLASAIYAYWRAQGVYVQFRAFTLVDFHVLPRYHAPCTGARARNRAEYRVPFYAGYVFIFCLYPILAIFCMCGMPCHLKMDFFNLFPWKSK